MRSSKNVAKRLAVPLIGEILASSAVKLRKKREMIDLGANFLVLRDVWSDLVALEVKTDQVMPIARAGDLLLFEQLQSKIEESHFGMPVLYKTQRGEHGFRHLHHTEKQGLFNLVATGLMAPPLLNVRIEQVARLALTVPRELLEHVLAAPMKSAAAG